MSKFDDLYKLSVNIKMAKIALSIIEANNKDQLKDTVFLFETNETLLEFTKDQLKDVIEFTYNNEEDDFNLLLNFISSSERYIKDLFLIK